MNPSTDLLPLLDRLGWSLPLFLIAFASLWFAKMLYQRTETFDFANELTEKDNPAFGASLSGYLLGTTIALTAAFPKFPALDWPSLQHASVLLAVQGVLVAVLMRASVWIVSHGVMHRFGVRRELIDDRNAGAGSVLAGGCIAAGLVLHGALSGESASPWMALRDLLVFWALGQAILVLGSRLFNAAAGYDVQGTLEANNLATGFSLAGFLVAVGIIVDASLTGAADRLLEEVVITLAASAIGLLLLLVTARIAARAFLPHAVIAKEIETDRNPAA
ncbi:MAG: DUF350 domain-containing protein, partial [Verrucomicrobiota bacterium]